MNVLLRMTRAENTAQYGTGTVTLDMEEYLCGVVPAEVYESSHMDALKAQAIAARTFAARRAMAETVMDDTTSFQAYRYSLAAKSPRSRQAIEETRGQVLCYDGSMIDCFYSASNGGLTKRSGDVWSKHYPYYVNKTDEWDAAANVEKPTKASHGIGLSQIGAMWAAKNGVPYTQILAFYYDGTALVGDYGSGGSVFLDEEAENKGEPTMKLSINYMTRNDCYTANRKITPSGIMVHSTATPGIMAADWFFRWNKSYAKGETDRQVCVHAFLDDKEVCQYLPWNHRGWHAGGTANNTHIGFEICEPAGFKYSGGATMVGYDVAKNEAYFRAVWKNAVELCVLLCKMYGLNEGNIICHSEGYKKGIASNHADVMHWFPKHGESMDTFRTAVKKALASGDAVDPKPEPELAPTPGTIGEGALVEFKAGTTRYYPGSKEIPGWVISDYNHRVTQVTSGGKPVTKGKKTCVLLGRKVKKTGGAEEAGINTWVATDVLSVVGSSSAGVDSFETYTVKKGDTLWGIATAKLGSGARYPEIKALNGLTSDTITTGQKLKIPKK